MPIASKTKGLLFILAPFAILIATLFLRVVVGFFSFEGVDNVGLNVIITLLNFTALLCVIGILVLVPLGIFILIKKGGDQPVVGNQLLAGRGERWAAKFLDGLITTIPAFVIALIVALASSESVEDSPASTAAFWLVFLAIFAVQAYYLTTQGQTIAKKWLKIRIVDVKTHKVGGFVKNVLLRSVLNGVFSIVPFYGLVDALFIFRENRRCVHDLLAGTIVVRANSNDKVLGNAKFCTHCGAKVMPHAQFCVGCGTALK